MKYIQQPRLGPDVAMRDEVYSSPYILVDRDEYRYEQPGVPLLVNRGASYRNVPRGDGSYLLAAQPGRTLGSDLATVLSNPWVVLLLVGVAGLIGYYVGKPAGRTRRNPPRRVSRRRRANRKLRRYVRGRRRDAQGRFV